MGRRLALLVATYRYEDPGLRQLTSPAHDAEALAAVLADPGIAGFEVTTLVNEPHHRVGAAVGDFYRDLRRDDLTLLYFTGHGVKDDMGRLYLALANTRRDSLLFTALSADQIDQAMEGCVSRQKVLILDCCYSGAFPAGRLAKGDTEVHALERFQGRGRTVLTASDATQYSFEGDQPHGAAAQSLFTRYLVAGLRDGSADLDGDGDITIDELYSYVHDRVVEEMPQQRPKKQDNVEGRTIIARNVNWALPAYLRNALDSPIATDRRTAVDNLAHLCRIGNDLVRARIHTELVALTRDDSKQVSAAAAALLRTLSPPPTPPVPRAHEEPALPAVPEPPAAEVPSPRDEAEPPAAAVPPVRDEAAADTSEPPPPGEAEPLAVPAELPEAEEEEPPAAAVPPAREEAESPGGAAQNDTAGRGATGAMPQAPEPVRINPPGGDQPGRGAVQRFARRMPRRVWAIVAGVTVAGAIAALVVALAPGGGDSNGSGASSGGGGYARGANWTLEGANGVIQMVFSKDDTMLFGLTRDGVIKKWKLDSKQPFDQPTTVSSGKSAKDAVLGPEGRTLAVRKTPDRNGASLFILDAATGAEIGRLSDKVSRFAVAFSPDGGSLATANMRAGTDYDNSIKLWTTTGHATAVLPGIRNGVNDIAFSPDGRLIAAGGVGSSPIMIWDLVTHQELRRITTGYVQTTRLAFSKDGTTLAALVYNSDHQMAVKVWNVYSGQLGKSAELTDPADGLGFNFENQVLVFAHSPIKTYLRNPESGVPIQQLMIDPPVTAATVSADGDRFAVAGAPGIIGVF